MSLASLHASIVGVRNNVIIPRLYLSFLHGDYTAALILEEIVFESARSYDDGNDGWFPRTATQWQADHMVSRKQVGRAVGIANLKAQERGAEDDLIQCEVRKVRLLNGSLSAEVAAHYRLDRDVFDIIFSPPDRGNSGNEPLGNSGNEPLGNSLTIETGKNTGNTSTTSPNVLFEQWYSHYPRKVAKVEARAAFTSLIKQGVITEALLPAMIKAIATTVMVGDDWAKNRMKFVPHPATWLRDQRWKDIPADQASTAKPPQETEEEQKARYAWLDQKYAESRANYERNVRRDTARS